MEDIIKLLIQTHDNLMHARRSGNVHYEVIEDSETDIKTAVRELKKYIHQNTPLLT